MKTVLICSVQAPFIVGGAEILVADLRQHLERRGFRVDVVNLPFKWYPVEEIVHQALAWRLLDLTESNGITVDLVIPTKFPSFLARHPRKVPWLFHQHREAYDLRGTSYCSFKDTADHRQIIDAIWQMDTRTLGECPAIYTISQNVANRLEHYNGLAAQALYPPPRHLGAYHNAGYGNFLFYAGRLDRLKRLELLLDALKHTRSGARVVLAGTGPVEGELKKQIVRLGLEDRVTFAGFVSDEELVRLYSECRAAYYAPFNEDYGYVTVEAFLSGKPVVTTSDAGGPLEFVTADESGLVAEPQPPQIAEAIDRLWALPEQRLRDLGEAGRKRVAGVNWDHVVDCLTEGLR
jgi:glycosyltransferase involved in cell wall biosynthesis